MPRVELRARIVALLHAQRLLVEEDASKAAAAAIRDEDKVRPFYCLRWLIAV